MGLVWGVAGSAFSLPQHFPISSPASSSRPGLQQGTGLSSHRSPSRSPSDTRQFSEWPNGRQSGIPVAVLSICGIRAATRRRERGRSHVNSVFNGAISSDGEAFVRGRIAAARAYASRIRRWSSESEGKTGSDDAEKDSKGDAGSEDAKAKKDEQEGKAAEGDLEQASFQRHNIQAARETLSRSFYSSEEEDATGAGADARTRLSRAFSKTGTDAAAYTPKAPTTTYMEEPYWAEVMSKSEAAATESGLPPIGSVLLANPEHYGKVYEILEAENDKQRAAAEAEGLEWRPDDGFSPRFEMDKDLVPAAANRTGMPITPPHRGRREKARLPVILITGRSQGTTEALLLGRWTGCLLGDFDYKVFMTRPLYMGGPQENMEGQMTMLHSYPELGSSALITDDGLAISTATTEEFAAAVDWVGDAGPGTPIRFKFFISRICWKGDEQKELLPNSGVWMPAVKCSRDLILREPDSSDEEPLWAQIAIRAGGVLKEMAEKCGLLAED
eukprot:TRINITY_DN6038_c0_g1_i4.p1 TRINITY_DN6038_c0_g1~~TRINITY_DN6038_c0_g1_i4.p1  ORF type:complete len:501 (+),score=70.27 TRINITY_DN6038_c0_g1_i4:99-1601(+)